MTQAFSKCDMSILSWSVPIWLSHKSTWLFCDQLRHEIYDLHGSIENSWLRNNCKQFSVIHAIQIQHIEAFWRKFLLVATNHQHTAGELNLQLYGSVIVTLQSDRRAFSGSRIFEPPGKNWCKSRPDREMFEALKLPTRSWLRKVQNTITS